MTQILVARALPSQFYCACRSIQAARILPGARLEILRGSAFTSRRPASLATTLLSFSPGDAATWLLLLVLRLPSTLPSASSNSIFEQVIFFSDSGVRELPTLRRSH